jgi:hypothetical protein
VQHHQRRPCHTRSRPISDLPWPAIQQLRNNKARGSRHVSPQDRNPTLERQILTIVKRHQGEYYIRQRNLLVISGELRDLRDEERDEVEC